MKHILALLIAFSFILSSFTIDGGEPQRGDKLRLNEIKARAARDFAYRYPQIDNERWFRYKTGFAAKFSQNQVLSSVYYDRMGYFITTIRHYREKIFRSI